MGISATGKRPEFVGILPIFHARGTRGPTWRLGLPSHRIISLFLWDRLDEHRVSSLFLALV